MVRTRVFPTTPSVFTLYNVVKMMMMIGWNKIITLIIMFLQGGEEQGSESEEPSCVEDDGTTLDDIKVKQRKKSYNSFGLLNSCIYIRHLVIFH